MLLFLLLLIIVANIMFKKEGNIFVDAMTNPEFPDSFDPISFCLKNSYPNVMHQRLDNVTNFTIISLWFHGEALESKVVCERAISGADYNLTTTPGDVIIITPSKMVAKRLVQYVSFRQEQPPANVWLTGIQVGGLPSFVVTHQADTDLWVGVSFTVGTPPSPYLYEGIELILTRTNPICDPQQHLRCKSSYCISAFLRDNGINNCGDDSDEKETPEKTAHRDVHNRSKEAIARMSNYILMGIIITVLIILMFVVGTVIVNYLTRRRLFVAAPAGVRTFSPPKCSAPVNGCPHQVASAVSPPVPLYKWMWRAIGTPPVANPTTSGETLINNHKEFPPSDTPQQKTSKDK